MAKINPSSIDFLYKSKKQTSNTKQMLEDHHLVSLEQKYSKVTVVQLRSDS